MTKEKMFYGWWIVIGATALLAIIPPGVVALASLFQSYVVPDLGITESAFALNNAILQAVGIFLSPFASGLLSTDKFKKIVPISLTIFSIGFAMYGLANAIWQFYLLSFIMGFAFTFGTIIPMTLMVSNWFVKQRGLAISITMTGIGIGGFVFSPVVSNLLSTFGWQVTYMIYGVLMLVVTLPLSLFVFKRTPAEKGLEAFGAAEMSAINKAKIASGDHSVSGVDLPMKDMLKKPFFIIFLLGIMFNGIVNGGTIGQLPAAVTYLHDAGTASMAIMIYSIVGVAGKLLLGRINDQFGVVVSTLFGYGAMILALIFMINGQSMFGIYGMAIAYGFAIPTGTVSPPLVTSAIFSDRNYSSAYGFASSAMQLGMTLGSVFVAGIYNTSGSFNLAWMIIIGLSVVTVVSWLSAYKMSHKYVK